MKALAYLLPGLLLACHGAVKEPAPRVILPEDDPSLVVTNGVLWQAGKQYTGIIYTCYPNGTDTLSSAQYAQGRLHGTSRKYYPGAKLMEQREYNRGTKHGLQVSYWETGRKRFAFTAKNDAYEGELREWSADGKPVHLAHFKNGQEEGLQQMWYDNGKIRANYVIRNGRRYGLLGTKNCENVSDSVFTFQ